MMSDPICGERLMIAGGVRLMTGDSNRLLAQEGPDSQVASRELQRLNPRHSFIRGVEKDSHASDSHNKHFSRWLAAIPIPGSDRGCYRV